MFGSHLSIAGSMHNALLAAEKLGFDTVQVFTNTCELPNGKYLGTFIRSIANGS